jgi:hypothetical protein
MDESRHGPVELQGSQAKLGLQKGAYFGRTEGEYRTVASLGWLGTHLTAGSNCVRLYRSMLLAQPPPSLGSDLRYNFIFGGVY